MKIVVKLGGELLSPARKGELDRITETVFRWSKEGHRILLIHGGGPQTSELQKTLGQEPHIVGGRRVTDGPTLEAIQMMVGGKLNITLVSALRQAQVMAVGLNGVSGHAIQCRRRPPKVVSGGGPEPVDFGFVGEVTGVNQALLDLLMDHGYTPVLACIGSDEAGQPYNINADTVANGVAAAVSADRLLLLTSAPGVLKDKDDPQTRIPQMTIAEGQAAISDGTVQGGMIVKLETSFETLKKGVGQIHILGHLAPGDLDKALDTPGSVGTALLH